MYSILNTVACTIALVICKSSALSVPFVTDEQFKIQKQSSTGAGILLIHKTGPSIHFWFECFVFVAWTAVCV